MKIDGERSLTVVAGTVIDFFQRNKFDVGDDRKTILVAASYQCQHQDQSAYTFAKMFHPSVTH
jgi:hypothetical protein